MSLSPMSSESTMVGYLMEVGWMLHLSSDAKHGHAIFKSTKVGRTTTVDKIPVSADCVLELQQTGRLKKVREFTVNHQKTTVFGLADGGRVTT